MARAKGKGFWKGQIASAYRQGRVDGAAKQEKNYEVGYHLGRQIGHGEGKAEGYKTGRGDYIKEASYDWRPSWRAGPLSTWERICRGKTH